MKNNMVDKYKKLISLFIKQKCNKLIASLNSS